MHNNIWENDKLKREEEAKYLIDYLSNVYKENDDKSFVLNINSEWGFGKTFFLNNFKKELENNSNKVIYFDAWTNDYTKEPLLAFMSKIDEEFSSHYVNAKIKTKSIATSLFKSSLPLLISILTKHLTGCSFKQLKELTDDEDDEVSENEEDNETNEDTKKGLSSLMSKTADLALKEHKNIGDSIKKFKKNIKKLLDYLQTLENTKLPLYILIDELDRCRPNYAIELLENIKHLFDIKGLIFVIATDSKQLSHSINAIYGNKFESTRYLKRFFDKEYVLAEPATYNYVEFLMENFNLLDNENIFSLLPSDFYPNVNLNAKIVTIYSDFFKLSLRDINQCLIMLNAIVYTWTEKTNIHLGYILYLIMLKQKHNDKFEFLINNIDQGNIYEQISTELVHEVDNNINVIIGYNYEKESTYNCNILSIVKEYHQLRYLTIADYVKFFNHNSSDSTAVKIRTCMQKNLPQSHSYNSNTHKNIKCEEFIDYPNFVIRGNRFT